MLAPTYISYSFSWLIPNLFYSQYAIALLLIVLGVNELNDALVV